MENQKILIVDDREEDLFVLEKALRDTETEIVKAVNGNDALTATLYHEFALAILDVYMPDMSGFELASFLRSDDKTRSLPIIFITATLYDQANTFKGYESGAIDYIVKPYNPLVLQCKAKAFLELAKYRKNLEEIVQERTAQLEKMNYRLASKAKDLARSNKDLEDFAYIASHDLREPLHNIAIALQMIQDRNKGKLDQQSSELMDYAVGSAQKMKVLINNMLHYSRLNRDRSFQAISIADVVKQSIANLGSLMESTNAQISYGDLPVLWGDSSQLIQVFQNLIQNALKFAGDESPSIQIEAKREGEEWIISVRDNGIGIDADQYERIFMIFQQLEKKKSAEGTGMGLTIVKKIVELHRGRVWVESRVGIGSTFYISLPNGRS
jgi:signal transduction histidine kinase